MVERVRATLAGLDRFTHLAAVVARDDEAAIRAAEAADAAWEAAAGRTAEPAEPAGTGAGPATGQRRKRAPMAGVPLTVKDWIDVAGLPCLGETAEYPDRVPTRDATAVARLRAAGAIVVAKTHPGPVHPVHGTCRHPADPRRTPGGSSSGEAALLGAGVTTVGLGSDSGGSIRLPAAWCGVAGLKPSAGLVPVTGHFPEIGARADGRTTIGPLAARVADLARVLAVIAGPDGVDPGCVPVPVRRPDRITTGGLRVAMVTGEGNWLPSAAVLDAVHGAAAALRRSGATLLGETLPEHLGESLDITMRYWQRSSMSGAEAQRQLRDWDRFSTRMTAASRQFDLVLGPTVADVAPYHRPLTGEDYVFTMPWSLTGWPAVTVPFGVDPATGLPLAVQVAAPRFADHVALRAAMVLERDRQR